MRQPYPSVASLWAAQAPPAEPARPLATPLQVDVAIVGGGYSGLSAAHYLIEQGLKPVVLEARRVGWGASGRNGGVVSAKFRMPYSAIAQAHGLDTARLMHRISHDAVDLVESLIERLGIETADFRRTGNLSCAHNQRALARIAADARWQVDALGDDHLSVVSAERVAEETGSNAFVGGVLADDVGRLRPLAYARGLADGLCRSGSDLLFEDTPVERVEQVGQGVRLHTPGGSVQASQVILASNGYSGITPATDRLRRSVVPFRSAIIATEPLPESLHARLLKHDRSYGETRRMMRWFRKVDDRFVFGGRGAFGREDSAKAFDALQRAMVGLFPDLAGVAVDYRWSGHVAMTLDKFPHVGRLDDRTTTCVGYNGAGVALSTLLGRHAGACAAGHSPEVGLLAAERLKRIPFYPLRELGIRSVAGWYQLLDAVGL
ncbi:FAD-binding oxidoreductase [Salinisphaera sp. T31B1]|uniref:NAD(P)/FAD-dependent oxidoreductase n=1 Tax=Salinisphaera sp. T31B1 TaxID=727963 RepID=UPI003342A6C6